MRNRPKMAVHRSDPRLCDRPDVRCSGAENNELNDFKIALPDIVVLRQISKDANQSCSAPNSRSSSFKIKHRPQVLIDKFDGPRRQSMPDNLEVTENDGARKGPLDPNLPEVPLQRVRSFKMSSKGQVINRGDSFRRKRATDSNPSLQDSDSSRRNSYDQKPVSSLASTEATSNNAAGSPVQPSPEDLVYQVSIIGALGVGKTALKAQFMTSDYTGDIDTTEQSQTEAAVPVNLDDEESIVLFTDKDEPEDLEVMCKKDAIVVMFAVNNRKSYDYAVDCLFDLRQTLKSNQVIILVANKADIVRSRTVTAEEAKTVAEQYRCKYTETSSTLNHNIDELLVGIIKQIRIFKKSKKPSIRPEEVEVSKPKGKSTSGPRRFFKRIVRTFSKKQPKKCENLYED